MGTITARKRSDNTVGYTAQIRLKRNGKVFYTESLTFDRRQTATAWLKKRETALAVPGVLDAPKIDDPTLSVVIDRYNDEKKREHGKTKTQVLNAIKASDIGSMKCSAISSHHIIEFAQSLAVQPQTIGNYLSHLASIFTVARPAWGYPLNKQAMDDARVVADKMGIVSRSKERHRRPTLDEIEKLLEHFTVIKKKTPQASPMSEIILFALFSTRRQEEITRITWADLNEEKSEVIVRDMKNPGEKIGNDVRVTLPPEALMLIKTQPRTHSEIWPYKAESISASFTRACKFLEIKDLHFHDLRHEGISRLFEMGSNIPQVATVSGHRTWASLKRYTHINQAGDKYADWKMLQRYTQLKAVDLHRV